MQFPVRDDAAIAFSAEVYRQLAEGEPIETAVAEGRLAIRRCLPETMEWGTPVLFLRSNDGHLFEKATPDPPPLPRRGKTGASWLATLLAGGLALGIGIKEWPASPLAGPEKSAQAKTEPRLDPPPPVQPTESPVRVVPDPAPRKKPPKPKPAADSGDPRPVPPTPRPAAPHGPYKVSSDSPVYLPEIQAELSIQFHDLFGEKTLQLFLSPQGGSVSGSRALLRPDSVDFGTTAGKVWIDVQSIDWEHQTIRVQPRLEAG
jgi:hypothetical protein